MYTHTHIHKFVHENDFFCLEKQDHKLALLIVIVNEKIRTKLRHTRVFKKRKCMFQMKNDELRNLSFLFAFIKMKRRKMEKYVINYFYEEYDS